MLRRRAPKLLTGAVAVLIGFASNSSLLFTVDPAGYLQEDLRIAALTHETGGRCCERHLRGNHKKSNFAENPFRNVGRFGAVVGSACALAGFASLFFGKVRSSSFDEMAEVPIARRKVRRHATIAVSPTDVEADLERVNRNSRRRHSCPTFPSVMAINIDSKIEPRLSMQTLSLDSSDTDSCSFPCTDISDASTSIGCDDMNSATSELIGHDFGATFDALDNRGIGTIGIAEIQRAVPLLNERHDLGLAADDAQRLLEFIHGPLNGERADLCRVNRAAFVSEVSRLCGILKNSKRPLSVKELKFVVAATFERFDKDHDGKISVEDFTSGAALLGLKLDVEDATCLYRFFAPSEGSPIQRASLVDDRPEWEKWGDALNKCGKRMRRRSGLHSAEQLAGQIRDALERPGSPQEKVQRAMEAAWEGAEKLADAASLAVDAASMGMAVNYIADTLNSSTQITAGDLGVLSPFAAFLGISVVNLAKELDELVIKEMTEDEALLYAQLFHPAGFSQAQFRRLLSLGGCRWETAPRGSVLPDPADHSMYVIVRGKAELRKNPGFSPSEVGNVEVAENTIIGATKLLRGRSIWKGVSFVAKEDVRYVEWDVASLRECLDHDMEMSRRLDRMLATSIASNLGHLKSFKQLCGTMPSTDPVPVHVTKSSHASHTPTKHQNDASGVPASLTRDDLRLLLSGVGAPGEDLERNIELLDPEDKGAVDLASFEQRLDVLQRCLDKAPAAAAPAPAFAPVEEAAAAAAAQSITAPVAPASGGDGGGLDWLSALRAAAKRQAEKSGLAKFCYHANRVQDVFKGEGNPIDKARSAMAVAWDGADGVADLSEVAMDATGAAAALLAMFQEVCGGQEAPLCSLDEGVNLAPLMIFVGISSVRMMRHLAEGHISDLSEREVSLYNLAFRDQGLTVSDFRRLMKCASWAELGENKRLEAHSSKDFLAMVAAGTCEVNGAPARVGEIIGDMGLLPSSVGIGGKDAPVVMSANESATALVWDVNELRTTLSQDEKLQMKVHRVVMLSAVDRLLGAHGPPNV